MVYARPGCLGLILVLLGVAPAMGSIVQGIEFTDPISIDVEGATNIRVTTSEDAYVFAPGSLFVDEAQIAAIDRVIIDVGIDTNAPFLCAAPISCATRELDLASDVVVTILEPVGSLRLQAGGSIIVSPAPIPEPGTGALLGLGVLSLGAWRRAG